MKGIYVNTLGSVPSLSAINIKYLKKVLFYELYTMKTS
jgi:hypothetical protein